MSETRFQRQAVPAYFHPLGHRDDWARLASARSVALVVANVADGPGIVREEQWALAFRGAHYSGCDVVGYVDTGFFGLSGLNGRRGSTLLDEWLEQILSDIDTWYRLYGDVLAGIFFDQVAESEDGASIAPVLRRLRDHTRQRDPNAITVLNPGAAVPPVFQELADILVTYEGSCHDYLREGRVPGYQPLTWRPGAHPTIWHIVHGVPDAEHAVRVVALSRSRGAGLLYMTDGRGDNPYAALPSSEIWTIATAGCDGGVSTSSTRSRRRERRRRRPRSRLVPTTGTMGRLISNPEVTRIPPVIEATADFLVPCSCRRLFLATRGRDAPRWWTGSSPQIAADWLVENDRLYAYAGTGTDWVWTPSGRVAFEVHGNRVRWRLDADRDRYGVDGDAVFHVSAPGHCEYSEVAAVRVASEPVGT